MPSTICASATKPAVCSRLRLILAAASLTTLAAGCSAAPLSAHHDRVLAERARYTNTHAASSAADVTVTSGDGLLTLAAGRAHVCGIRADGAVLCWGSHAVGQLGRADLPMHPGDLEGTRQWSPSVVDGVRDAVEIGAGTDHTCARHVDPATLGTAAPGDQQPVRADVVSCWGHGSAQAGRVELDGAAVGLASGAAHSCALLDDATIQCWGWSEEVGYGADAAAAEPLEVPELDGDPIAVLAAGHVTCAPLDSGRLACWSSRVGHAPRVSYLPDANATFDILAMDDTRLCATRGDHNRMSCWEISALNRADERNWSEVRVQAPDVSWVATGIENLFVDTGRACAVYDDHIQCDMLLDSPMPSRHQQVPGWVRDRADVVDVAAAYGWGCMVDEAGETRCWGQHDARGDSLAMTPAANARPLPPEGISLIELELLEGAPVATGEPLTCAAGTTPDTTPHVERCLDALGQPTGPARLFHDDGSLRAEGRYRSGAREGRWTEWSEDAEVVAGGNYRDGARDGAWTGTATLDDGTLHTVWQGSYRDGAPHGTWRFQPVDADAPRTAYYEAGRQTAWMVPLEGQASWELVRDGGDDSWRLIERDATGAVRYQASVAEPDEAVAWTPERAGAVPSELVLDGPYQELYPDGTVAVSGQYVGGEPEGTWKTYFADGTLASERTFATGLAQGPAIDWHDDGTKAREGRFVDGLPDGVWQSWHRNGQLASRGDFDEGMPQGRWTWWYADGTRKRQGSWHDPDEPIRGERVDRVAHAADADAVLQEVAFTDTVGVSPSHANAPFDAAALTAERLTALERLLVVGIEDGVWQSWAPDGQLSEHLEFDRGRLK